MKTVMLLRHAKTIEASPPEGDHGRALTRRGHDAAAAAGSQLAAQNPDLVLCSTARRATETWGGLSAGRVTMPPVRYEDGLYLASVPRLLQLLEALDDAVKSVWVIGHNPGLHELARHWAIGREPPQFPELLNSFPTMARATFRIDADYWHDIADAAATVEDFAVAR
jgi:phosphohistidine phosphatase